MTVSPTTTMPVVRPSQPTSIGVRPSAWARSTAARSGSSPGRRRRRPRVARRLAAYDVRTVRGTVGRRQLRAAGEDRAPVDGAGDPDPAGGDEVGDSRVGPGVRRDGARDRVLGRLLQRPDEAEQLLLVDPGRGRDGVDGHLAGGDGAGLVEHDRVDAAGGLEDLRALDEDAELGAPAGADHQRGRRREPEGARAGDDQHRHRGGEGRRRPGARAEPEAEGGHGQADHDRDEDPGDAVREALHLGLAVLGVLDEAGHLRELGVGADPGGAHDEAPAGVDGRADDGVARSDLDRDGLAGQHAAVDRRAALGDLAVGGDGLARAYDEVVAHRELLDGDRGSRCRRGAPRPPWRRAP